MDVPVELWAISDPSGNHLTSGICHIAPVFSDDSFRWRTYTMHVVHGVINKVCNEGTFGSRPYSKSEPGTAYSNVIPSD